MRMIAAFRATRRSPLLQVLKSAVAAVAAWLVCTAVLPGPEPVFGAIAALLVVQPSLNQSFAKGVERTVGVLVGVLVATGLGLLFGERTWVVLAAIVIALLLAWLLRMTAGAANQVAISAMLVLTLSAVTPGYGVDRLVETLIGAAIGFVVNVVMVPPLDVVSAHRRVDELGMELAGAIGRLAGALLRPQTPAQLTELMLTARLLRPMRDSAAAALDAAVESLALNPRAPRHRAELTRLRAVVDRFTAVVTQVVGMTRTVVDRYDRSLCGEPTVAAIAEQLRRAVHDVRLLVQHAEEPGDLTPEDADDPALTRQLVVAAPRSDAWVLVGSLLVDLHRIHDNLTEA